MHRGRVGRKGCVVVSFRATAPSASARDRRVRLKKEGAERKRRRARVGPEDD